MVRKEKKPKAKTKEVDESILENPYDKTPLGEIIDQLLKKHSLLTQQTNIDDFTKLESINSFYTDHGDDTDATIKTALEEADQNMVPIFQEFIKFLMGNYKFLKVTSSEITMQYKSADHAITAIEQLVTSFNSKTGLTLATVPPKPSKGGKPSNANVKGESGGPSSKS